MDIPDNVREIVDQLGAALVKALANDEGTRALAMEIQDQGFDVMLMLEIAMTLHKRGTEDCLLVENKGFNVVDKSVSVQNNNWSDEDRDFLKAFRISAE